MTKSVGCHKRVKPSRERWLEGRGVAKAGCRKRQLDPSGPDNAEWKTDECGKRLGDTAWRLG